ncbi:MAG: sensor histidine kinase [Gaiellaceae bacterium]
MQRSRRFWRDVALVAAALGVGLGAEASAYGFGRPGTWMPDLLVGWTFVACGLVARRRGGLLLATTGLAWYAGNFTSAALLLHRAPLAQLALTYPSGRTESARQRGAIAFAYASSLAGAFWWGERATFALSAVLAGLSADGYVRAVGRLRRERAYALRAAGAFAALLALVAAANGFWDTHGERVAMLRVYEGGLAALAFVFVYGLLRQPWQRAGMVDLVVDLGETRAGSVRDALSDALGDSTLVVAYRVDGGYIDAAGRPVVLPEAGTGRHITRIERDGVEVAALVHDAAMRDDPALLAAVGTATRLAAANARLQAEVRAQVAELAASRRRLLEVSDAERRRLEATLHAGALTRLARLDARLARTQPAASAETAALVAEAREQLARTSSDLRELAAGLHPRDLVERGLGKAVAALAERSPVPVEVTVPDGRLPEEVELTLFFVCAEALANVWKHAHATRVTIEVERSPGSVRLEIRDDGIGGAEPRWLTDRVESSGGKIDIYSPSGRGTRLVAELPLH